MTYRMCFPEDEYAGQAWRFREARPPSREKGQGQPIAAEPMLAEGLAVSVIPGREPIQAISVNLVGDPAYLT